MELTADEIRAAVQTALREDIGPGDATTLACVPADCVVAARLCAREPLVVSGLALAADAFRSLDPNLSITWFRADGYQAKAGECLLEIRGPARPILSAERTALNFVQWLSGVATHTAAFVAQLRGLPTLLLDTRKTTPGYRRLEKYAVTCGGGCNHRFGLFDMVLIKDNHLAALAGLTRNPVGEAVSRARRLYPGLKVEVEADTLEQVRAAVAVGADFVLLDNMSPATLRQAVAAAKGRTLTEASGGVRLDTIREVAETGVDYVSAGAIVHGARWVDLGLDFVE
jgi:nicotinate-nucleotide pyrophosphorylase (carboxylating)